MHFIFLFSVMIDFEETIVVNDGNQHPETEILDVPSDVPSCSVSSKENQNGKAINKRASSQRNILSK